MNENKVYMVSYINNVNGQMTKDIKLFADSEKAQEVFDDLWFNKIPEMMCRYDLQVLNDDASNDDLGNDITLTDKFNHDDVISLTLSEMEIQ